jgi:hypothetical protein
MTACSILSEGLEKATKGMNGSQSKFIEGTWPISQIGLKPSLFQLGQDYVAIEKLLALETGLGTTETQRKIIIDTSKVTCETKTIKINSQNNSSPLSTF